MTHEIPGTGEETSQDAVNDGNEHGELKVSAEQDELEVMLVSDPTLTEVLNDIRQAKIDWRKIARKYSAHQNHNGRRFARSSLPGLFMEMHIDFVLQELARQGRIKANPIQYDDVTEHYRFRYTGLTGGVVARNRHPRNTKVDAAEYDSLFVINAKRYGFLPVVLESKMTRKAGSDLRAALQSKTINRIFRPLSEKFATRIFGYGVVALRDVIKDSPSQRMFQDKGGILVDLPLSGEEYEQEVARVIRDYKLQ